MSQCITCARCMMLDKGNCTCLIDPKRTVKQSLTVRECKDYKLAPMHSVKSRSARKMTFDNHNKVVLT